MFNIRQYLEKFKKIQADSETEKEAVIKVLLEFSIPVDGVVIKNKVATVQASSIAKNQIYMKKAQILEKLPQLTDII